MGGRLGPAPLGEGAGGCLTPSVGLGGQGFLVGSPLYELDRPDGQVPGGEVEPHQGRNQAEPPTSGKGRVFGGALSSLLMLSFQ